MVITRSITKICTRQKWKSKGRVEEDYYSYYYSTNAEFMDEMKTQDVVSRCLKKVKLRREKFGD